MQITLETTLLASPDLALGCAGPSALSLNGRQLVDEAEFFGAALAAFYARGNAGITFQFTAIRLFSTIKAAERFYLLHSGAIPLEGLLICEVGESGDTESVYMEDAVVEAVAQPPHNGVAVAVQYTIRGAKFSSDVPDELPGTADSAEETVVIRRGSVAIAADATSVAVVFSAALSAVPVVTATVSRPTGGDNIWAMVREDSITVNGFTADLSAAATSANFKLNYIALE